MPDNKECRGWAYVGSANLSESAWCVHIYTPLAVMTKLTWTRGRIVKDTKTKQLKISCRNWECGVIVPIINEKKTGEKDKGPETHGTAPSASLPVEIFTDTVPVPIKVPAVPLSEHRKPFFFGVWFNLGSWDCLCLLYIWVRSMSTSASPVRIWFY